VEHLYCPGQDGIVVGAAGITIDLKGFTLRGDRTGGNHGISDEGGYGRVTKSAVLVGAITYTESGRRPIAL
jgi:hypothetical protein